MLVKAALILVVLGTVGTEPIRRSISNANDVITSVLTANAEELGIAIRPETIRSMGNFFKSVIGFKLSALAITVKIVHWLISNLIGIAIGGLIGIGICKITGKINLDHDYAMSKLYSIVTPERLEMAQNLLISAIRRLGQEEEYEEDETEYE